MKRFLLYRVVFAICVPMDVIFVPLLHCESGTLFALQSPTARRQQPQVGIKLVVPSVCDDTCSNPFSLYLCLVDEVLEGWRCSLESLPTDDDKEQHEDSSSRKRKRVEKEPLVQVVFIGPDGKVRLYV